MYIGKLNDKLDVDLAAQHLANFLLSCKAEMQLAAQAIGKQALRELDRSDLVTVEKDLAEFAGIRYAASHRTKPEQSVSQKVQYCPRDLQLQ